MKFGGFVLLSISIAVAVLTLTSVLVPAVSMAVDTEDTFTNNGIVRMTKLTTEDEVIATWDHTDPYNFTVNDVKVALPQTLSVWSLTVAGSDHEFMIRYIPNDNTYGTYLTVFSGTYANVSAGTVDEKDLTLTINQGSITVTNGTNTNTNSFSDYMFIVSNDGEYVMKNVNDMAYVLGDSDIHGIGRTWLSNSSLNMNLQVDGTIDDGFTVTYTEGITASISDIVVTDTTVNGYVDLYQFKKVDFNVTYNDKDNAVSYGQVIVPYEVTAEKAIHADSATITLFEIIPIFMVLAILLGIVAVLYVKYRR